MDTKYKWSVLPITMGRSTTVPEGEQTMMKKQFWIVLMLLGMFFSLILAASSFSGTVTYQYDRLNRIIKMEKPGEYILEYAYDKAGNRTAVTTFIESEPYDHDGDDDLDGLDLQVFASGFSGSGIELKNFANLFGTQNKQDAGEL